MAAESHCRERVSLIICTNGKSIRLRDSLLAARAAVEQCRFPAELLVVDNSTDGSVDLDALVRSPVVRKVNARLPGLSRARTVGCIEARGEVLVFTDDDVIVDPDWLSRMAAPILGGSVDATSSLIALSDEINSLQLNPMLRLWLAEVVPGREPELIGAGMGFHRRLLQSSLWDQMLGAGAAAGFGEEWLFWLLARRSGARIAYADGPPAIHYPDPARTTKAMWIQTARKKGASAAYIEHHLGERPAKPFRTVRTVVHWARLRSYQLVTMNRLSMRRIQLEYSLAYSSARRKLDATSPIYGTTVWNIEAL